jgi:hypothetical protein
MFLCPSNNNNNDNLIFILLYNFFQIRMVVFDESLGGKQ